MIASCVGPLLVASLSTNWQTFPRPFHWPGVSFATGRDAVLVVKIDDVHSRAVPHQHPPQVDLSWAHHVPHRNAPVLAAGDHHPVAELGILEVEAEVEDGLTMVDQGVHHLPTLNVPHSYCAVRRTRDDHLLIVLQAEDRACVSC